MLVCVLYNIQTHIYVSNKHAQTSREEAKKQVDSVNDESEKQSGSVVFSPLTCWVGFPSFFSYLSFGFILCARVFCLHMCLCMRHTQCSQRTEEDIRSPGAGVTASCEASGC